MTNIDKSTYDDFNEVTEAILDGAHLVAYLGYQGFTTIKGRASVGTVCGNDRQSQ